MEKLVKYDTLVLNGVTLAIVGDVKYKNGNPKTETKTAIVGTNVSVYQKTDFSEAMGQVTFSVMPTPKNIEVLEDAQLNAGRNAVKIISSQTGHTKTFGQMSITEDLEFDTGSEIEVTMNGGQGR